MGKKGFLRHTPSGQVNLSDGVLALLVLSGMSAGSPFGMQAEVDGGTEEAVAEGVYAVRDLEGIHELCWFIQPENFMNIPA